MPEIPATLQILTNLSCPLACTYCYEQREPGVIDVNIAKTYIHAKFRTLEARHINLDLLGGESFLYPEICEELCDYALELGKRYGKCVTLSFCTNGVLVTDPRVQAMLLKYKNHNISIGVSIDGTRENHNRCRVYHDGSGSYDDAVAALPFLFATFGVDRVGVKATFTLDTFFQSYVDSVKNLIELGFTSLATNIVFEEVISKNLTYPIYFQLKTVIDYLITHKLYDKVTIFQLGDYSFLKNYRVATIDSDSWCGTHQHMSCLGLDHQVYGCNRFCTMNKPGMHTGELAGDTIISVNPQVAEAAISYRKTWDGECRQCLIRSECPTCPAGAFEAPDMEAYTREKRQCGWTHAIALARLYFQAELAKLESEEA